MLSTALEPLAPLLDGATDARTDLSSSVELARQSCRLWCLRTAHRSLLVGTTAALAIGVPYFPQLVALVGAGGVSFMVYILPVAISWRLLGDRMGMLERAAGVLILAIGLIAAVAGTVFAMWEIVHKLQCSLKHEECGKL